MGRSRLLRFYDSGEDDGSRTYDDDGYVLCERCGTRMNFKEDFDVENGIAYYECPKCKFIEIEEFYDDENDISYEEEYYRNYNPDDDE